MMMKAATLLLLSAVPSLAATSSSLESSSSSSVLTAKVLFQEWKATHGKTYGTEEEHEERWLVWAENDARIREHNNDETKTFQLGHNEYSDMTQDEFAAHFKLGEHAKVYNNEEKTAAATSEEEESPVVAEQRRRLMDSSDSNDDNKLELPDYVNWVQLGGVTPVKNQGACGSCWAFSTTGALEGAKFVKTGELVSLSEQNLVDCDHKDMGCSGGLMDNAFKFDETSGGLCSEDDYPYKAHQGKCQTNCTDVTGSEVATFMDVPPGHETALLSAIAMQPISVAIEASQFVFQFYKNGVLNDDTCGSAAAIDHGVLAVGYGTDLESQLPYFLVKNSWGETWGDNGYIKLGRKSKNEFGICAILKMASFPMVA